MPKKKFPDVAADFPSSESLSFAGLVSTQGKKESSKLQKEDLELESRRSNAGSTVGSPNNYSPAKSISNYQQATTIHASCCRASKQIPLESFLQIPGDSKKSDTKQKNHQSSSREQVSRVKRRAEKRSRGDKSFSQKLFLSFATPCRDCRASQPTPSIKQHTLQ